MSPLYTYQTVIEYAEKIVSEIGVEKLYTETNTKYPNAPKNYLVRSPKLLIPIIKRRLKELKTPKKIHLLAATDLDMIEGLYANIAENLYVVYSDKISEPWKRFTIIKELCSAYTAHYQAKQIDQTVYECDEDFEKSINDAYKHKVNYVNKDHLYEGDIDSETFAILLATEIMIPRPYRHLTEELIKRYRDEEIKLNDVAKSLMIPETILEIHMEKKYL